MSENGIRLLEAFDALPMNEQQEILLALLRRTGWADDSLSAEALTSVAEAAFLALDEEERLADESQPR